MALRSYRLHATVLAAAILAPLVVGAIVAPLAPRLAVSRTSARTRKRAAVASLTGAWSGQYAYEAEELPPVAFNALLDDDAGALSGSTQEPNTFAPSPAERLTAVLSGTRAGPAVSFEKTYDGSGGQTHTVYYSGESDAEFTRIAGSWRAGPMRGTFFMTREVEGGAEGEERAEEASA